MDLNAFVARRELKPYPHLAQVLYPVLKSEKDRQQPSLPAVKEASLYRNSLFTFVTVVLLSSGYCMSLVLHSFVYPSRWH